MSFWKKLLRLNILAKDLFKGFWMNLRLKTNKYESVLKYSHRGIKYEEAL